MPEYRCTRNALYTHDGIAHDDLSVRQGYYLQAENAEEAWQKMALKFPEETEAGFTMQEWESFNIRVIEIKRNRMIEDGNEH